MSREWVRGDHVISTDRARLNIDAVHAYLSVESYWAGGVSIEVVRRSIENSMVFGVYDQSDGGRLVGFARIITDSATFAYLCDVFVVPDAQGKGLGVWLVETIASVLEPMGLRQWALATRDAHTLYEKVGFVRAEPGRWMNRRFPDVYKKP